MAGLLALTALGAARGDYQHGKGKRSKPKFVGSEQFTGIDPNKAGKTAQRPRPGRKIPGARIPTPLGGRPIPLGGR